jgi:hypothetical protein
MELQSKDRAPLVKRLQAGRKGTAAFSGLDNDESEAESDDHVVPVHRGPCGPRLARGELGNYGGLQLVVRSRG